MKKFRALFLGSVCFLYTSVECMTLREAITTGDYVTAHQLIMTKTSKELMTDEQGITFNAVDASGRTIFYMAAEKKDLELFVKLAENYSSIFYFVNIAAFNEVTPLKFLMNSLKAFIACKVSFCDVQLTVSLIDFLLEHGAQYTPTNNYVLRQRGSDYW